MKKYVLWPWRTISKFDGDLHYISAPQLARLYGVPMDECVVGDYKRPRLTRGYEGLIHLYPSYSGNYALPAEGLGA